MEPEDQTGTAASHGPAHGFTVHIVDGDSRARAEHARAVLMLGYHAEVYSDVDELLDRPPRGGVIMVRQSASGNDVEDFLDRLGDHSIWAPVIVVAADPSSEQIVDAIHGGAVDYLDVPLEAGRLARSLNRVFMEHDTVAHARWRMIDARRRVASLSPRGREVLELLSIGCSNKATARKLGISPRTVEIHRANMMLRLGVKTAAEALRIWLLADLEREEASHLGLPLQQLRQLPDVAHHTEGPVPRQKRRKT